MYQGKSTRSIFHTFTCFFTAWFNEGVFFSVILIEKSLSIIIEEQLLAFKYSSVSKESYFVSSSTEHIF